MKDQAGESKDSFLIHCVRVTSANVHDLTPAAKRLL
jgi:hypothetical protein